jgi:hypothetical protein
LSATKIQVKLISHALSHPRHKCDHKNIESSTDLHHQHITSPSAAYHYYPTSAKAVKNFYQHLDHGMIATKKE